MYALYASCEGYRVCLNGHEKGHYDHKLRVHQWNHRDFETTAILLMKQNISMTLPMVSSVTTYKK